ncbi:MAG: UDP-N-acetylglucosamine acyltransferase [Pseudohongiellaceae bacterium]|jgi:UDP-N-acetylglucosamine acyltransferase
MSIDDSARIHPSAVLGEGVSVGPWSIIGPNVIIGANSVIESHVVIRSNTTMGEGNRIFQFCSVGEDPADKKFSGEDVWLEIGNNNIFREGVTVHRGTEVGGSYTRIGDGNLMMSYAHVAHDCIVGSNTVFANNSGISGHVEVGDWAILGGLAGVNQFIKIGPHAMVGGMTHIDHDVPAFVIVSGQPAAVRSVNTIGLERRGFDKAAVKEIRKAFKILYKRQLSLRDAISQIEVLAADCPELAPLLHSLTASEKGIHR